MPSATSPPSFTVAASPWAANLGRHATGSRDVLERSVCRPKRVYRGPHRGRGALDTAVRVSRFPGVIVEMLSAQGCNNEWRAYDGCAAQQTRQRCYVLIGGVRGAKLGKNAIATGRTSTRIHAARTHARRPRAALARGATTRVRRARPAQRGPARLTHHAGTYDKPHVRHEVVRCNARSTASTGR
jgi:hypothetical protein